MTGLPNSETFNAVYTFLTTFPKDWTMKYALGWPVTSISKVEQLFITLVKLRRGMANEELGVFMKVDHVYGT